MKRLIRICISWCISAIMPACKHIHTQLEHNFIPNYVVTNHPNLIQSHAWFTATIILGIRNAMTKTWGYVEVVTVTIRYCLCHNQLEPLLSTLTHCPALLQGNTCSVLKKVTSDESAVVASAPEFWMHDVKMCLSDDPASLASQRGVQKELRKGYKGRWPHRP